MKSGTLLIFGLIAFVVLARGEANIIDGTEPDCARFSLPACTREYEPVCGTDGEVYSNECMLCMSNSDNKVNIMIRSKGEC